MTSLTRMVEFKCKSREAHPIPRKVTICGRLPHSMLKDTASGMGCFFNRRIQRGPEFYLQSIQRLHCLF